MKIFFAFAAAATLLFASSFITDAVACSPPSDDYSVSDEIPSQIPAQGALPVVFHGSSETRWSPLEDPDVTFEVRNSNDKLIPGDGELYTIDVTHRSWGSIHELLLAWSPTDGWTVGETYSLYVRAEPYGTPEEIEHTFSTVDASGDVLAPTIDGVGLSVREDRASSDCCVPDEDVYDSCTGQPVRSCWTTEYEYTPVMRLELAPVASNIWASQTLYTLQGDSNRPLMRPSTDSSTTFSRDFSMEDSAYCLTPVAVRIVDGSTVSGEESCRGPSDLPEYEERDATDHVGVPEECQDQVDADAGGDAGGSDAGGSTDGGDGSEADAGAGVDDGGSSSEDGASSGGDGTGSGGSSTDNDLGGASQGCGCASPGERSPVPAMLLVLVAGGLALRRR
ncbi:MAG: MYXO-CTERM sorting domain-containing protein [Myxococcota bacterium]